MAFQNLNKENIPLATNDSKAKAQTIIKQYSANIDKLTHENQCLHKQQSILVNLLSQKETELCCYVKHKNKANYQKAQLPDVNHKINKHVYCDSTNASHSCLQHHNSITSEATSSKINASSNSKLSLSVIDVNKNVQLNAQNIENEKPQNIMSHSHSIIHGNELTLTACSNTLSKINSIGIAKIHKPVAQTYHTPALLTRTNTQVKYPCNIPDKKKFKQSTTKCIASICSNGNKQLSDALEQIGALQSTITAQEKDINAFKLANQKLTDQLIASQSQKLQEYSQNSSPLNQKEESDSTHESKTKDEYVSVSKYYIGSQQQSLSKYENIFAKFNMQISTLQNETNMAKQNAELYKNELNHLKEYVEVLTKESKNKNESLTQSTTINESLIAEQKKIKDEMLTLTKEINNLTAKYDEQIAQMETLQTQNNTIKKQLEAKLVIDGTLSSLSNEKSQLQEKLLISEKEIKKLKESYNVQKEYSNKLDMQLESMRPKCESVEQYKLTIQEMTVQIDELINDKHNMEKQCSKAPTMKMEKTSETKTNNLEDNDKIRSKLLLLKEVNAKLQVSIIEKTAIIDKLKQQNSDVTKEVIDISKENSNIKIKTKEAEEKLRKAIEEKLKYKELIEINKAELHSKITAQADKTNSIETKYETMLNKERAESKQIIDTLRKECQELRYKIQEATIDLTNTKEIANKEYNNNKTIAVAAQSSMHSLKNENQILLSKIEQMQKENEASKQTVIKYDNEIKEKEKLLSKYISKEKEGTNEVAKAFGELENYATILEKLESKVTHLQEERDISLTQKESIEKELHMVKEALYMCTKQ